MRNILAGVMLANLVASVAAFASDSAGHYVVLGPGNWSCGKWTADSSSGEVSKFQEIGWVQGFLTAYNDYVWKGQSVMGSVDGPGVTAWTNNYCTAHPLDTIGDATHALILDLQKRN
ncbi:MAG TPA: hypothetical protein VNX86_06250 [Rhizomicrobium sp.]|jgi:hypothetical protein|nr:hypothetical protein [Rhizomicrobium sp.]